MSRLREKADKNRRIGGEQLRRNKAYWEEGKYSELGRANRRYKMETHREMWERLLELQDGAELPRWATMYDCGVLGNLQAPVVASADTVERGWSNGVRTKKLDTSVNIQSKVNHVWDVNRFILRICYNASASSSFVFVATGPILKTPRAPSINGLYLRT